MPVVCWGHSATAQGPLLYISPGLPPAGRNHFVRQYDPITGLWTVLGDRGNLRTDHGVPFFMGGSLYTAGGVGVGEARTDVARCDAIDTAVAGVTTTWTTMPGMVEPRSDFAVGTCLPPCVVEEHDLFDAMLGRARAQRP
jgi:hypothetical protein